MANTTQTFDDGSTITYDSNGTVVSFTQPTTATTTTTTTTIGSTTTSSTTTTDNGATSSFTTISSNLGDSSYLVGGRYASNSDPNNPWYVSQTRAGFQMINPVARGILEGSPINWNNLNLTRVCDFKFVFNFGISLLGLINPAAAIAQAIKRGRLWAAAQIRAALADLIGGFRDTIKKIILLLGIEPTGYLSKMYSLGKETIRQINNVILEVANMVEHVYGYIALIQNIQAIVKWIMNLPAQLKALLQRCLTNFQTSLKQFANDVKNIPNQVLGQVQGVADYFTKGLTDSANLLKNNLSNQSTTAPTQLLPLLDGSDKSADYDSFKKYISDNIPSTKEVSDGTYAGQMKQTSKQ